MAKNETHKILPIKLKGSGECYKIESIMSVDGRGQMVLPKEIRQKAGICPGEKLALISWEKDSEVCCMFIVKAEKLADMVKGMLKPLLK